MVVFTTVINFIKKNPKIIEYAVIAIIVYLVAVIPVKNQLKQERAERHRFEQRVVNNVSAMQDSVRVMIDENGDKYSEKLGYTVQSIEELKQYDERLFNELGKSEKNLKSYINSEIGIVLDKVGESDSEISQTSDSTFDFTTSYNYADSGLVHDFKSMTPLYISNINNKLELNKGKTQILTNTFNISLNYRTVVDDETGKTKVVARSKSPYVEFDDLNTVFIENKSAATHNSRFGVGPVVGFGYTNAGFSPFIGVGVNWNLITIKKKK